ncbi:MAG: RadC family protein [Candidatus Brocadiia bacterium]
MDAELRKTYRALEEKLREVAGAPLEELVGSCGERQAAYPGETAFDDDPPLRRLLGRLGLLRGGRSANLYELVRRMAEATGERLETVRRVLRLYCAPSDGVPRAICGEEPACSECPLRGECRFFQRTPTITDLPVDQRPRERLIAEGAAALSDAELLAIILRSGTREQTAIGLAHKLLARFGSFRQLVRCGVGELSSVKGIGPAKAAQIKAALDIGRRLAEQTATRPGRQLTDSQAVYQMYSPRLRDRKKETFLVLLLDAKNRVFREVEVSVGSLTASAAHPREVFGEAVRESAAAILCVHNHPAGDPTPSAHDIEVTRKLAHTGRVLGIHLLDHVVVGDGAYYSFADEGQLGRERRDHG